MAAGTLAARSLVKPSPVAPTMMTINGTTYQGNVRPKGQQHGSFTDGTIFSDDGNSYWTPIPKPGVHPPIDAGYDYGAASSRLAARAAPRAATTGMDFSAAKRESEAMLPDLPGPVAPPPQVAPPPRTDFTAANAAMFGRAKDRIGQIGQGAMKTLQSRMSRRGLAGSGIEGAEMGELVDQTRGELGDVVRDQTIADVNRNASLDDRDFAAAIGQRGTDMGFTTTTRGQDINARQSRASLMPSFLSLLMRSSGTGAAY